MDQLNIEGSFIPGYYSRVYRGNNFAFFLTFMENEKKRS